MRNRKIERLSVPVNSLTRVLATERVRRAMRARVSVCGCVRARVCARVCERVPEWACPSGRVGLCCFVALIIARLFFDCQQLFFAAAGAGLRARKSAKWLCVRLSESPCPQSRTVSGFRQQAFSDFLHFLRFLASAEKMH